MDKVCVGFLCLVLTQRWPCQTSMVTKHFKDRQLSTSLHAWRERSHQHHATVSWVKDSNRMSSDVQSHQKTAGLVIKPLCFEDQTSGDTIKWAPLSLNVLPGWCALLILLFCSFPLILSVSWLCPRLGPLNTKTKICFATRKWDNKRHTQQQVFYCSSSFALPVNSCVQTLPGQHALSYLPSAALSVLSILKNVHSLSWSCLVILTRPVELQQLKILSLGHLIKSSTVKTWAGVYGICNYKAFWILSQVWQGNMNIDWLIVMSLMFQQVYLNSGRFISLDAHSCWCTKDDPAMVSVHNKELS